MVFLLSSVKFCHNVYKINSLQASNLVVLVNLIELEIEVLQWQSFTKYSSPWRKMNEHLALLAEGHYISNETLQSKHFVSVLW